MTPVRQTKLYGQDGIHNGNCFAACLASLLDLPLWMVPPFEDMFARSDSWRLRVDEWLSRFFGLKMIRLEGLSVGKLPEFYIANGRSARGVGHSVIYSRVLKGRKGEVHGMVHDPHPSDSGILTVEWTWHLEAIKMPEPLVTPEDFGVLKTDDGKDKLEPRPEEAKPI